MTLNHKCLYKEPFSALNIRYGTEKQNSLQAGKIPNRPYNKTLFFMSWQISGETRAQFWWKKGLLLQLNISLGNNNIILGKYAF